MGNAGAPLEVDASDRRLHDFQVRPAGPDEHFGLESVSAGPGLQLLQLRQRVDPESALAVLHLHTAQEPDEQVADTTTDAAFRGVVARPDAANADDDGAAMTCREFPQRREVRGVVLPIRVDGEDVSESQAPCLGKPAPQRRRLAPVQVVGQCVVAAVGIAPRLEQRLRRVAAPVVDDEDGQVHRLDRAQERGQRRCVVVGRRKHEEANASGFVGHGSFPHGGGRNDSQIRWQAVAASDAFDSDADPRAFG
jgi:hypothetical protein